MSCLVIHAYTSSYLLCIYLHVVCGKPEFNEMYIFCVERTGYVAKLLISLNINI